MTKEKRVPVRVTALLDGRPGHEKQTKGILHALSTLVDIEVTYQKVPFNSVIVDFLTFLKIIFQVQKTSSLPQSPQLLIGTGRRTHLPLLQLKKKYGCPVITCMSPSLVLRKQFDLCFIPYHDEIKEGSNVFHTIGPPNTSTSEGEHKTEEGLILLGGKDYSHYWNTDDIKRIVEDIVTADKTTNWTISSSPRTPASTVSMLKKLDDNFCNCTFFDYKDTPAGWIEEKYAQCQRVWVTADSMSMVYEAMSAGCRVGLIPVKWKKKKSKFAKSQRQLIEEKRVITYEYWFQNGRKWQENISILNESDRCANEIVRRWWPKN